MRIDPFFAIQLPAPSCPTFVISHPSSSFYWSLTELHQSDHIQYLLNNEHMEQDLGDVVILRGPKDLAQP
jgi:hypothetical protein